MRKKTEIALVLPSFLLNEQISKDENNGDLEDLISVMNKWVGSCCFELEQILQLQNYQKVQSTGIFIWQKRTSPPGIIVDENQFFSPSL